MVIDIQEDLLKIHQLGLLDKLLADKTTQKNILWATDAYCPLGAGYGRDEPITAELAARPGVIMTRAAKQLEQQFQRTRRNAEVSTPLWVCRKMNDYADEMWFGRKEVFFKKGRPAPAVVFPKKKSWKRYVNAKRLEITCGEAPYLASRYDAGTGERIPVSERIGLLDRKLRVVTEKTKTEAEWLKWAFRAFRATYGYELQGDNLLIARVNLLMTFAEHLQARWGREPSATELRRLVHIITWNLWQMDGLTGTVPFSARETAEAAGQGEAGGPPRCLVRNWTSGSVAFSDLPAKGKTALRFDFAVGNPPYQDETVGQQKSFARPIYHLFLDSSCKAACRAELIHPARFLFDAGSTPKAWNRKMLSDPHFKVLYYERDAGKIFSNTEIKGGVAITCRDAGAEFGAIGTFTPYPELNSILQKVRRHPGFESFSSIVITRTACRLTEKLHADHPGAAAQLSEGHAYDMSTNIFERLPQVFFAQKPQDGHTYIEILGREGTGRVCKYIREEYVNKTVNLHKYKIYLPKANGAGILGEAFAPPVLAGPGVGATETFLSIGAFDTLAEAEAALKYIKTRFARMLLGVLKTTQDITPQKWAHVPLQDFTAGSEIDWAGPVDEIDRCLYKKYRLSKAEIHFIQGRAKRMD